VGDSDSPALSKLPERFGNYTILGHLATGGMAEVYLARQIGIEGFVKTVVIKRIRPELTSDREITGYFLDEARLVATLQHPNIAQVYEIGRVNDSYFLVMEYVDGADLRQLMERAGELGRRIPIADAIYILIQACVGLHYAHEKRGLDGKRLDIIHRDVTPSNVLLSHDGAVKVCDFGIAKATTRTTETVRGALKGKYPYMSPEQCKAAPLDRRSDVFALGVLLYELSTLTRPFAGDSDFELLRSIIELPAPLPSGRVPDYPPDLERVVMRALAKDAADRYPTAQAMQLDLEALVREHRFALSSVNIANLMAELFNDSVDAWVREQRDARALADPLLAPLHRAAAPVFAVPGPPIPEPTSSASSGELDIETQPNVPALRANQITQLPSASSSRDKLRSSGGPASSQPLARAAYGASQAPTQLAVGLASIPSAPPVLAAVAPPLAPAVSPLSPTLLPPSSDAHAAHAPPPDARAVQASRDVSAQLANAREPAAPPLPVQPGAHADAVRPARRASPLWLVAALLAGLFAAGISLAGRLIDRAAEDAAGSSLDADAERLAAILDNAARSARLRADGIAATPLLRAAIETDAATMKDLAQSEYAFSIPAGDTLEIFQTRNGKTISLLRLPESSPATQPVTGSTIRIEAAGQQLSVIAGAPIQSTSRTTGSLTITARADLGPAIRQLAPHAVDASLRGRNLDVRLVDSHDTARATPRSIPLPTTGELAASTLTLVAVVPTASSPWIPAARNAAIALAGLLLAAYLFARRRPTSLHRAR